jgi:hypothetical protein
MLLAALGPLGLCAGLFIEPGVTSVVSAVVGVLLSLCTTFGMCYYGMPGTFWRKDFGPLAPLVGCSFFLWFGLCLINFLILSAPVVGLAALIRLLVWRWNRAMREASARSSKRRQFEGVLGPLPAELPATLEDARREYLGA